MTKGNPLSSSPKITSKHVVSTVVISALVFVALSRLHPAAARATK